MYLNLLLICSALASSLAPRSPMKLPLMSAILKSMHEYRYAQNHAGGICLAVSPISHLCEQHFNAIYSRIQFSTYLIVADSGCYLRHLWNRVYHFSAYSQTELIPSTENHLSVSNWLTNPWLWQCAWFSFRWNCGSCWAIWLTDFCRWPSIPTLTPSPNLKMKRVENKIVLNASVQL